jgi:hypothetical protein
VTNNKHSIQLLRATLYAHCSNPRFRRHKVNRLMIGHHPTRYRILQRTIHQRRNTSIEIINQENLRLLALQKTSHCKRDISLRINCDINPCPVPISTGTKLSKSAVMRIIVHPELTHAILRHHIWVIEHRSSIFIWHCGVFLGAELEGLRRGIGYREAEVACVVVEEDECTARIVDWCVGEAAVFVGRCEVPAVSGVG